MKSILTILQRQYDLIEKELIRYQNNPYDADRTHDLRVAIRTLRGLFKFLKRDLPPDIFADIDKSLSKAAKIFNDLREFDVLIAKSSEFAYNHPEKRTDYRHFFQNFRTKRKKVMRKTLTKTVQKKLTTNLTKVKDQLGILDFDEETDWNKYIYQELKRRKKKLTKFYDDLDFKDYTRVHHIRKKAKTLRYSATYFMDFAPKKAKKVRKKAKKIQDVCGNITDAHVNYGLLYDFAAQSDNQNDKNLLLRIAQAQQKVYNPDKKED
ncbi:CHAD domain-containing protein [Liquorilactobacillus oeni]|nr:CHAD domain-containing protein [Liquorilactobacillus oeni]